VFVSPGGARFVRHDRRADSRTVYSWNVISMVKC